MMRDPSDNKLSEQQRRGQRFIEERIDLLDTIRKMVDIEVNKRIGQLTPPPQPGRKRRKKP